MSNEKNKDNNSYAIAHALASGAVGFVTVFLLTTTGENLWILGEDVMLGAAVAAL